MFISFFLLFLLSSPASLAPERKKYWVQNSHLYVGNSLGATILGFFLSVTSTYLMHFLWGRPRGQSVHCTSCWKPFIGAHARMTHQPQVHGWHSVIIFIEKVHKQEFIKKISCRNEKDVGMGDEATD